MNKCLCVGLNVLRFKQANPCDEFRVDPHKTNK